MFSKSAASVLPSAMLDRVKQSLQSATDYAMEIVSPDGWWCGETRADATFTSQYVYLRQQLGLGFAEEDREALKAWFLGQQQKDGSWPLAPGDPGSCHVSVEAYLALKILGMSAEDPAMIKARDFILSIGGIERIRNFTRVFLATFGLVPWSSAPKLPPEVILLPSSAPFNVYRLSYWARIILVPLLLIRHHQPIFALPNGKSTNNTFLDELWLNPKKEMPAYGDSLSTLLWNRNFTGAAFRVADDTFHYVDTLLRWTPIRTYARRKVMDWIIDRQEEAGDLAGLMPGTWGTALSMYLEGFKVTDAPVKKAVDQLESLCLRTQGGKWCQSCDSIVWDTVLMVVAIKDCQLPNEPEILDQSIKWLQSVQRMGGGSNDWRVYKPYLSAGGWAFEVTNTKYPDLDDTSCAIMAILKHNPKMISTNCIHAGVQWIVGLQNTDGGWGGFEFNNSNLWLNDHPFSDMKALCDPSTPDVTGHILEGLSMVLNSPYRHTFDPVILEQIRVACDRAIAFVIKDQTSFGGWWGRWTINYLWGTCNVLCGLEAFQESHPQVLATIDKSIDWLKSVQNPDGGWGEGTASYKDIKFAGKGENTPSQTAWSIMALLTRLPPTDAAVQRGVLWLLEHQNIKTEKGGATWEELPYTGCGFPNWLYMQYTLYPTYFPMMALGRYKQAVEKMEKQKTKLIENGDGNGKVVNGSWFDEMPEE